MEEKINSRLFFIGMLSMALTALLILLPLHRAFEEQARADIRTAGLVMRSAVEAGVSPEVFKGDGLRITIISPTGAVVYESTGHGAEMDNHLSRQEIAAAIEKGEGESSRKSATMGYNTYYYAIRLSSGNILRVAQDVGIMSALWNKTLPVIILSAFGILLLSVGLSIFLTGKLVKPIEQMGKNLADIENHVPYPELAPFAASIREYQLKERHNESVRKEFTANVSHELKTPLTSISGYAEMIENDMVKTEDVKAFASRIHKEAGRMIALIGDIIRLTELDEPESDIAFENTSIMEVCRSVCDSLEPSAEKAGVMVTLLGDEGIIEGNRTMLTELVYNLCENAIRYNLPGGSVDIFVSGRGGRVSLTVQDTGIGIPKESQSRVFERFYRVDKSHSKETGGTGLGLAIVKHAAALHKAAISLKSEEGKGTKIEVVFPKTRAANGV